MKAKMTGLMQLDDSILGNLFFNARRVFVGSRCSKRMRRILMQSGNPRMKLYFNATDNMVALINQAQVAFLQSFGSKLVVIVVRQLFLFVYLTLDI